jgi:hypothetical protein
MKYLAFVFFTQLLLGCSSQEIDQKENEREIEQALEGLEERKEVDFGPSRKDQAALQFLDKSEKYGLNGLSASTIMLVHLNQDEYIDLVLIEDYFSQAKFFLFDSKKNKFTPIESLFNKNIKSSYIVFTDFNKDGITDALSAVLNQKTELSQKSIQLFYGEYKEGLLHFIEDESFTTIPPMASSSLGIIDYNLDGYLDFYIGNWFTQQKGSTIPAKDFLYVYKDKKYQNQTKLIEGEDQKNVDQTMFVNAAPTYGVQVCDVDQNGFPDILTTSTNGYANKLWLNKYKFREQYRYLQDYGVVSGYAGDPEGSLTARGGGRTFGVACADYNNDGIMDVFLGESSHNYDSPMVDKSSILTGSTFKFPPKFIRTEYVLDAYDLDWSESDKRGVWFDYNNDGLLDLLVENSGYPPHSRMLLFKQLNDNSFLNIGKEVGIDIVNPLSTVILDINKDGYMDILTTQSELRDSRINPRLYLFENRGGLNRAKVLRVFLSGVKANTQGLNATVELKINTKDGIETRMQTVAYSYGGLNPQNEEGVHFAVDKAHQIQSLKIVWPYSKNVNNNRAGLEKFYNLENVFIKDVQEMTFCENGKYLLGRKSCR